MVPSSIPRPRVVRVRGRSMEPTLHEGDLLLTLWGARPRRGCVAVVHLPPDRAGADRPVSVKRITGPDPVEGSRWWLDSDNPREGVTSFDVGSIAPDDVLATVVARLWPRPGKVSTRHTG
ncbi:S24/S26 family peptidase [Knoellia sp. Soil729]|uniref:S24/S26 family peptidase n=1 Tax=Knoellia sp. Soil729 TaxID=1736394 RepID=UPI00191090A9|nr:S24/S26 family peptidase [Knoellia sp. Soil729]